MRKIGVMFFVAEIIVNPALDLDV